MKLTIEPAASIEGAIAVPGVKGISQRAVLLGAIADGESRIDGFGRSADTETALSVVRQLGVKVDDDGSETVRVRGVGLRGLRTPEEPLDFGNAGTVLRLAAGILAGQEGRFELVGDESLSSRPQERIAEPLRQMGARVETTDGHAPVVIVADGGATRVVEPNLTRDHTERLLRELGVSVRRRGAEISVSPVDSLPPVDVRIAGDISSAAPFILAATLLSGSELLVQGVNVNPLRAGFLDVLERMGANIAVFNRRTESGEPVADLEVRSAPLTATQIDAGEVPRLIDELPLVALAAALARGETVVRGAAELRVKETDRIETVTTSLKALGVRIAPGDDGFRVRGVPSRPRGGGMGSFGDHRLAMLGAVAGLVSREGVRLEGAEAVAISFPGFFDLLESVTQR
ncbi:MAG: 3-phosphoshikimate 1-carboxyvinyltransferase [Actinobacteria bacterium]|nr:MAG: 3-phosphoshikimate 1-carboxyvinyltransferase [Actinomycetota bacterium]